MTPPTLAPPAPDTSDEVVVDPRIQARRDEVARGRQRRLRLRLGAVAAVVLAAALIWAFVHSPLLDVDRVIVTGTDHVSTEDVMGASGLRAGQPLFDVDPGTVRQHLLALPWVADATVEVDWRAGDIHVSVTERTPVAVATDSTGTTALVDGSGRIIAAAPPGDTGLVAIEGLAVPEVGSSLGAASDAPLQIIAALGPGLRTRIAAVVVELDGSLHLRARPDVDVDLCSTDQLDAKVAALTTFYGQVDDTGLATVSVCDPANPFATRKPA